MYEDVYVNIVKKIYSILESIRKRKMRETLIVHRRREIVAGQMIIRMRVK